MRIQKKGGINKGNNNGGINYFFNCKNRRKGESRYNRHDYPWPFLFWSFILWQYYWANTSTRTLPIISNPLYELIIYAIILNISQN